MGHVTCVIMKIELLCGTCNMQDLENVVLPCKRIAIFKFNVKNFITAVEQDKYNGKFFILVSHPLYIYWSSK